MIYYIISFIILISISVSVGLFLFINSQTPISKKDTTQEKKTTSSISEKQEVSTKTLTESLPINIDQGKVEIPTISYKFYQGMDAGPFDIVGQKRSAIDNIEELKKLCNDESTCVAFNTNGWLKWKIGPRTQWSRWTEDSKKGMYIKDSIEITPKASEWQCLPNIKTPLLLNNAGEVQCMSFDRKNCLWSETVKECNDIINENKNKATQLKPLVCGTMHKNITGSSGYDNPDHWCSKGKTILN